MNLKSKILLFFFPVIWCVSGCPASTSTTEDLPSFLQTETPFVIGAPLCLSGQLAARESTLEQALSLAEEYMNGDPRAYEVAADDIPCRKDKTCGAWVGTDAAGEAIRGPVRIVLGDTEGDATRALQIASKLRDDFQPPAMIAACTGAEMETIFENVTKRETTLITPVVTADFVSKLPDRTTADELNDPRLPGYVYRTVQPDYVVVKVAAIVGQNYPDLDTRDYSLIRAEDETEDDCTSKPESYCASTYGADYQCHLPRSTAEPKKIFTSYTEDNCGDEQSDFCDKLGANFACGKAPSDASPRCSSGECCGRYKSEKVCAKIARPVTAMVLYENSGGGIGARDQMVSKWVDDAGLVMLSTAAFDPASPVSFGSVISDLFQGGLAEEERLKATLGSNSLPLLPATHQLGDSVVFLFAEASDAALLLQEWGLQLQAAGLPETSEHVFWLGPDSLRSDLLTNQVSSTTLRNLYVIDSYSLEPSEEDNFVNLFKRRWNNSPSTNAGSAFDAALMAVAANERAGRMRERQGNLASTTTKTASLGPNSGTDVKNSLPQITVGCLLQVPFLGGTHAGQCAGVDNGVGSSAQVRLPMSFSTAIGDLARGSETVVLGVTGSLQVSPAGDRMGPMKLWKIASRGDVHGFFKVQFLNPSLLNAYLDY